MHDLTYTRLLREDDPDIPRLLAVYHLPEVARYIHLSDRYFHYVTHSEGVYFYKVYAGDSLAGAIHLETQGDTLFMDILVFPGQQRKGLGIQIVRDVQRNMFALGCGRIEVTIDESNIASLRLFEGAGFVRTAQEDELITLGWPSGACAPAADMLK